MSIGGFGPFGLLLSSTGLQTKQPVSNTGTNKNEKSLAGSQGQAVSLPTKESLAPTLNLSLPSTDNDSQLLSQQTSLVLGFIGSLIQEFQRQGKSLVTGQSIGMNGQASAGLLSGITGTGALVSNPINTSNINPFETASLANLLGAVALAPNTLTAFASPTLSSNNTAGLGNTGLLNTGVQNGKKQVVVLDDATTGHGQTVLDVAQNTLLNQGMNGISTQFVQQKVETPPYQNLTQSVDDLLSGALSQRSDEISQLAQSGQVGVINMSNGLSPIDIMQQLGKLAFENPSIMSEMKSAMGLGANATMPEFYQALSKFITQRTQSSPKYQQALSKYQNATKFAEQKGVAVVVAAGNSKDELAELKQNGIMVSDEMGMNLLSQSNSVITVGAVDSKNTATTADDTATTFSSPGQRVEISANGVDVLGNPKYEGTSYSAPQVSDLIASIQASNPNLSVAQIRQILKQTAVNTNGISNLEQGSGQIQWQTALSMAQTAA